MTLQSRMVTGIRRARLLSTSFAVVSVALLAVLTRRSKQVERRIATVRKSTQSSPSTNALVHDLREVSWSVTAAARYLPGATCLTQALAGDWLLARRGRTGEIRLSLPTESSNGFRPHAWLFCDDYIVLGGTPAEYRQHQIFGPGIVGREARG